MTVIIDYGVGNLFSLRSSFASIGEEAVISAEEKVICAADRLILPGVGAFGEAAQKLKASGLDEVIRRETEKGKPLLGICLGMQLLFDRSFEFGEYEGLGLIKGEIRPISEVIPAEYKIPHIGWNGLRIKKQSKILDRIHEGECVYFVHSYSARNCDDVLATAEYGAELTAAVGRDNIFGCQFHPEKSGDVGLDILRSFCEIN